MTEGSRDGKHVGGICPKCGEEYTRHWPDHIPECEKL
jgi:hypothetical protein